MYSPHVQSGVKIVSYWSIELQEKSAKSRFEVDSAHRLEKSDEKPFDVEETRNRRALFKACS